MHDPMSPDQWKFALLLVWMVYGAAVTFALWHELHERDARHDRLDELEEQLKRRDLADEAEGGG